PGYGVAAAIAVSVPSVLGGLATLLAAWRRLPPCRRRRQLGWASLSLAIGALAGLDAFTVYRYSYPIGWAATALAGLVLFYAIAQHRLLAIRTVLRQTLVALIGLGLATLGGVAACLLLRGPLAPGLLGPGAI